MPLITENTTEGQEMEGAGRKSVPPLRAILDSVPVGISYFNTKEQFQFANQKYEFLLGVKIETLIGSTLEQAIGKKPYKVARKFAKRALKGEAVSFENVLSPSPGDQISVLISYVPDSGPDNVVRGFYALVTDITENKRLEAKLKDRQQDLEADVSKRTSQIREAYEVLELEVAKHKRSVDQYKDLLQASPDPTVYVDFEGVILEINLEVEQIFGYRRDELIGQKIEILVPETLRDDHPRYRQRYSRNPVRRPMGAKSNLFAQCKDGQELPVEISLNPALFSGNKCIIASIHNISLRYGVESALKDSREHLRQLLESTHAIPWEADIQTWSFTYVGAQAAELLGYPCERWLKKDFWVNHIHPDDKPWVIEYCRKSSQQLDNYEFEYRMIAKDGRIIWLHDIVNVVRENSKSIGLRGFMIEVTERKRSEKLLRELTARVIAAQEDEQKRIARELHDDLSQELALIAVELDLLGKDLPKNQNAIIRKLADVQVMALEASSAVHKISHRLHPAMLDQLGLAAAIGGYCNEISSRHGLQIEFNNLTKPGHIPADISLCFYRVLQESIQNVLKHSGSDKIRVKLFSKGDEVYLTVQDEGCGFHVDPNADYGLGLTSMAERMELNGGIFRISSEPGKGTKVTACQTLEREA